MRPVALEDVPALSRLLATATLARSARGGGRWGRPALIASIAVVMVLTPGWFHRDRRVVLNLTRLDRAGRWGSGRRLTAAVVAAAAVSLVNTWLVGVGLTLAGVYPLDPDAGAATWIAAEVGGVLVAAGPLAVLLAPWVVLAAHGLLLVRVPRVTWFVGALAAEPQQHALVAAVGLVREHALPGQTVGIQAADARSAVAYRRWGFTPVRPGSLVLTTRVPGAPPIGTMDRQPVRPSG